MATGKIDFLQDVQGSAHALLNLLYTSTYRSMLFVYHTKQSPSNWHIDTRADPMLYYSLLAFAQPEIFKAVYTRHNNCGGLLNKGLKFMYQNPDTLKEANRILDAQLVDPYEIDYNELYREARKELASDDAMYIEENKDNLNNARLAYIRDRHTDWLNSTGKEDDISTRTEVFRIMSKMI